MLSDYFITRGYQGEIDHPAIFALVQASQMAVPWEDDESAFALELCLTSPRIDHNRDVCLWETVQGDLVAFAHVHLLEIQNHIEGYLWWYVAPSVADQGLHSAIFQWSQQRLQEVQVLLGKPTQLRTDSHEQDTQTESILRDHGWIKNRDFLTLGRSLLTPLPAPQVPDGFELAYISGTPLELQHWVQLYNDTFCDHWNHHPITVKTLEHWLSHPAYQPELNLVAISDQGIWAAFCYSLIKPTIQNGVPGKSGWIELLGTHPQFRHQGLGRAILLAGLEELKKRKVEIAKLTLDAGNETGATRLYHSVGLTKIGGWFSWRQKVE